MVFVGVRQYEPDQILPLLHEKGDVGHDGVDARKMFLVAEGNAEVNRKPGALPAVAETIDRQVHADLADAPKRGKREFVALGHQAAPAEAARPKCTSPAEIGILS